MNSGGFPIDAAWRVVLKDLSIAPVNVLRRAGLPEDLLNSEASRLSPPDFYRFWSAVETESGSSEFALTFMNALKSEAFSPPVFAALCSPNLLVATQRLARYKSLVAPMQIDVREIEDRVEVAPRWLSQEAPPVSLVMTDLLFVVTVARVGTRENIVPLRVTSSVTPTGVEKHNEAFGVSLERGTEHAVVFSREDALRPFLTADEALWKAFEPDLKRRLGALEPASSFKERTRAVLLESLPSGIADMDPVARKLGVSKRTLQRRLGDEETTFKQILDVTRHELASHYLKRTELSSPEISFLLGFEEPTSFYRAVSRWTGQTPESLRQSAREMEN